MKTRPFLTSVLFALAMSASAQVQLLYTDCLGRNVIERNKKLFYMEGDDDPCYDIINYKKTGNKETFDLKSREYGKKVEYSVTMVLDNGEPKEITFFHKESKTKQVCSVKTSSSSESEDVRLRNYFNKLAGNGIQEKESAGSATASSSGVSSVPKNKEELKETGVKGATDKVKDAAKGAFGKVKGLFKKKK